MFTFTILTLALLITRYLQVWTTYRSWKIKTNRSCIRFFAFFLATCSSSSIKSQVFTKLRKHQMWIRFSFLCPNTRNKLCVGGRKKFTFRWNEEEFFIFIVVLFGQFLWATIVHYRCLPFFNIFFSKFFWPLLCIISGQYSNYKSLEFTIIHTIIRWVLCFSVITEND
jgi:hypothetical protein